MARANDELCRDNDEGMFVTAWLGVPFDPLSHPEPKAPACALDARVGGLGIPLVRRLSESLSYERADGRNVVRASLSWDAPGTGGADAGER